MIQCKYCGSVAQFPIGVKHLEGCIADTVPKGTYLIDLFQEYVDGVGKVTIPWSEFVALCNKVPKGAAGGGGCQSPGGAGGNGGYIWASGGVGNGMTTSGGCCGTHGHYTNIGNATGCPHCWFGHEERRTGKDRRK